MSLRRLSSNHKKRSEIKELIAFFKISVTGFRRAVDFYETVLGAQLPVFECETGKMVCFTEEGETVGTISYASNLDFLPLTHGILIHFNREDIEQTLEKVLLEGGKVVVPKTKIEADDKRWFTVFTDSEENRIDVYVEK